MMICVQAFAFSLCELRRYPSAPEILRCNPERQRRLRAEGKASYGPEIDCWAIGVLAFECLVGKMPYEAASMREMLKVIDKNVIICDQEVLCAGLTRDALDFIKRCMDTEPRTRISAPEMLSHPWIVKHHPDAPMLPPELDTDAIDIMLPRTSRSSTSPVSIPSSFTRNSSSPIFVPSSPARQRSVIEQLRFTSLCNTARSKASEGGSDLRFGRNSGSRQVLEETRRGVGGGGAGAAAADRRGSLPCKPSEINMPRRGSLPCRSSNIPEGVGRTNTIRSIDFSNSLTRNGWAPARVEPRTQPTHPGLKALGVTL